MGVSVACGFQFVSQDISANTSTYTFWVDAITNGGSYNNTGGARMSRTFTGNLSGERNDYVKFDKDTRTRIWTETVVIPHNADGTAQVHVEVSLRTEISAGVVKTSGDLTPSSIGRASSFTTSGGTTTGQQMTISISKANSSYTHTLTWAFAGTTGTIASKTTASTVYWTPDTETFARALTTNYYSFGTITCDTYNGNTKIGSTSKSLTIGLATSVVPSITNVSVTDPNGYYDTYNAFLVGKSKLKVDVTASALYGASIDSCTISYNGSTVTGTTATFPTQNSTGTINMTVTVRDSRGRSATKTVPISWTNRQPPTLTGTYAKRWSTSTTSGSESDTGTNIRVHYQGTINDGQSGSGRVYVYWRLSTDSDLTLKNSYSVSSTFSGDTFITGLSSESSYYVEVRVTDDANVTTTFSAIVSTVSAIMDFRYTGRGVAVGKVSEQDMFEVALPSDFQNDATFQTNVSVKGTFTFGNAESTGSLNVGDLTAKTLDATNISSNTVSAMIDQIFPVGSIVIRYDHTSPASLYGGSWTRISSRFLYATGSTGTIGATGGSSTHTLSTSEIPAHTHPVNYDWNSGSSTGSDWRIAIQGKTGSDYGTVTDTSRGIGNTGGGGSHNNNPAFINVSAWRRTA